MDERAHAPRLVTADFYIASEWIESVQIVPCDGVFAEGTFEILSSEGPQNSQPVHQLFQFGVVDGSEHGFRHLARVAGPDSLCH